MARWLSICIFASMQQHAVIIAGAGASGLMAARILAEAGLQVTVLEARDRIGGRIHTVRDLPFTPFADLGAEFIHGKLPETLALMKEAGLGYHTATGSMWQARNGQLQQDEHFIEHWDVLEEKLAQLDENITVDAFLEKYLAGEQFASLRAAVKRYAEGYDTADTARAAMLALKEEWLHEEEETTFRPDDGYAPLMQFLAEKAIQAGAKIYVSAAITDIRWGKENIQAATADGRSFTAGKIILTLPVGVWQAGNTDNGAIRFTPALDTYTHAFRQLGMGGIIKIMLQFKTRFWQEQHRAMENMMFLFSDEEIPTWWTQYPVQTALLTGWLGGPKAAALKDLTDEEILARAVNSLAGIFNSTAAAIREQLGTYHIANWTTIPYTCGSYSYATTGTDAALKILKQPVADTIYLSGEGLYTGSAMGTVEAALAQGKETALQILRQLKI